MKKVLASLFFLSLLNGAMAQEGLRPKALGLSFLWNDFVTAQRIRSGSIESVVGNDRWAKFREMSPGLAVHYFKGLQKHVDFAGTLAGSFVNYPFPNKPAFQDDALLLELDASVNLKMFTEDYWVTPYLSAGIGASKYRDYYGAFIPLGGGLKVNFFDDAAVFIQTQYRIGVTAETSNYHFMYSFGVAPRIGKK